jgi:conjugal transfer pilus assembly protein TraI
MRLNAAVRNALADIVATLNDSARTSGVCTVAEGIFVPLVEFERRGVQPGIAIRALNDTRMIEPPPAGRPPTVSRQVGDATVLGVVLAPAYVEGMAPQAFASPSDAAPMAPSGASSAEHRSR